MGAKTVNLAPTLVASLFIRHVPARVEEEVPASASLSVTPPTRLPFASPILLASLSGPKKIFLYYFSSQGNLISV